MRVACFELRVQDQRRFKGNEFKGSGEEGEVGAESLRKYRADGCLFVKFVLTNGVYGCNLVVLFELELPNPTE